MKSRFIVRRIVFGILAILFDAFTIFLTFQAIAGPESDSPFPIWMDCLVLLPFALVGLLFTWCFVVWQKRAISN